MGALLAEPLRPPLTTPGARSRAFGLRRALSARLATRPRPARRRVLAAAAALYAVALAVRALHAVDLAPVMDTAHQPGFQMTRHYDVQAVDMLNGDGILFPARPDPADTGLLSRPPGYPMLLAAVYAGLGRGLHQTQLLQDLVCALTPVLVMLLGTRALSFRVGIVAGSLVALTPHFAWNANLILPDAPCVIPVVLGLLALWAGRRPRHALAFHVLAGLCLGASVWLRPNLLLLAPFVAAALFAARPRAATAGRACALVAAAFAVVAPITIRNYVVFGEFVPVSINLGIVMWEGIADAGGQVYGAVRTDNEVARQEARLYGDPRDRTWWASPDGIRRDRDRVRRSLEVIRAHPAWFAAAMLGRMRQMLDYSGESPPVVGDRPPEAGHARGDASHSAAWNEAARVAGREPRLDADTALALGRALLPLRPVVATAQRLVLRVLTLLTLVGVALVAAACPRRALVLLSVPLSFLLIQSALHLEFRVTLPMHAVLFLFAGAAAVAGADLAWRAARAIRPRRAAYS